MRRIPYLTRKSKIRIAIAIALGVILIAALSVVVLCKCFNSNSESSEETLIDNIEGISLLVDQESVSRSELTLVVENTLDTTIFLDPWFCIEQLRSNKYVPVPISPGATWMQDDWLMSIYPDTQSTCKYSWHWYYGNRPRGTYRIVVSVSLDNGTNNRIPYKLASSFSIP